MASGNEDKCSNCGVPPPLGEPKRERYWKGFGSQALCSACYQYKRLNKRDRPLEAQQKLTRADREVWVAAGNEDICHNCGIQRPPSDLDVKHRWVGFQENALCNACHMYRFVNKKDRPTEIQQRPKRSDYEAWLALGNEDWLALGNEDKCVDCGAQWPLDAELEGNWRGFWYVHPVLFIPLSG